MSRFFSQKFAHLTPYTPGEQPKERKFVKLNTNESPFPPSALARRMAAEAADHLQLYPDPDCHMLTDMMAKKLGVSPDQILWTNGSDDILNFAFMAFCDNQIGAAGPEVSYGFYPVFAAINGVEYTAIPLAEDFSIRHTDYFNLNKTIFIANPNAPTGLCLSVSQIEEIVKNNSDRVVVIDEAYVDFGAESCVPLVSKYDNLLVTQTFSKSRSMAGARLGFGVGDAELIRDLNTIKYSTNPYNINSMTMAAGIGTLKDEETTRNNCKTVAENRAWTSEKLKKMGFEMTDSVANFIFVRHPALTGEEFYLKLKEKGVLVRHFNTKKISNYCRITIGSREEMETLVKCAGSILEEKNARV